MRKIILIVKDPYQSFGLALGFGLAIRAGRPPVQEEKPKQPRGEPSEHEKRQDEFLGAPLQ